MILPYRRMEMNLQAESLNDLLKEENPAIYSLLSRKGQEIYFPSRGILAQGKEARDKKINATIGMAMEDDGTSMGLDSVSRCIDLEAKDIFPYAPSAGLPELRKIWKRSMVEKNPSLAGKPISNPVICSALTHGLNMCGYLFVNPDDEIILPDLYWGNYNLVFKNAYQARFSTFPIFDRQSFNVKGLQEKLGEEGDKKILILNFPNNPTGFTPTEKEMASIVSVIGEAAEKGKKIVVICDDAYFGLVFEEGVCRESAFSYLADLHENVLAVKIDGATKEDYAWGFRVGFISYGCRGMSEKFSEALENKTGGAVRASISSGPRLSQSLLINAYSAEGYRADKQRKYDIIKSRYLTVKNILDQNPRYGESFEALPFNSGYFMCFQLKEHDGEEIRRILLDHYDTGVIALGSIIRIAYSAIERKQIPELIENLFMACKGSEE